MIEICESWISRDSEKMKDGDILRIRSESGILFPRPWGIQFSELPESARSTLDRCLKAIGNH